MTSLMCFSPDRLTCPLNSAVVLASYAVQCKSPREHFTAGQDCSDWCLKKVTALSCLTRSLPLFPGILLGKLLSGCLESPTVILTDTVHPHRDVGQGEWWRGKEWMSPYNRNHLSHIVSTRPSHIVSHNKPQWGKYFYQSPLIDMETKSHG